MALPKVKFKKMSIEENLNDLVYYLNPDNSKDSPLDFYKLTLYLFPKLEDKLQKNISAEELYLLLEENVKPKLKNLHNDSLELTRYQAIWNEINDAVMRDLEEKLNITWSCKEITGRFCLLPVCSRDILGKTFDLNYGVGKDNMIATVIHELCHIIYFEKWMELYPNYSEEEFDKPHIAWYLSEAMIDPLLHNETFQKYTNEDLTSYSVFYQTFIDGKSIIEILRNYVQNYSIETAIKKGYELFLENANIIKNEE